MQRVCPRALPGLSLELLFVVTESNRIETGKHSRVARLPLEAMELKLLWELAQGGQNLKISMKEQCCFLWFLQLI